MAKVNEFETATDNYGLTKQRFSDEANIHYRYPSAEELTKNIDDLSDMIKHHQEHQSFRLKVLRDYYKGNNQTILRGIRRREEHMADNRATHNFAKYVSQFIQGYVVGVPLKTTHPDEQTEEKIKEVNRNNDADEHNSDLVLDQSIYGRSYELIYRNNDDETKFTTLDVTETFVIYDETVECKPIAAVRYYGNKFNNDTGTAFLYTETEIIEFELSTGFNLKERDRSYHFFGDVPVIEYENNKYRQGDFEDVLTLIDLYDEAQSDTANYMTDLNDAMLKIVGNLDIDVDEAEAMKKANILMLQTETAGDSHTPNADAEYIYKQYDVSGTEAYKDRIFNNILLFTSIPNLLDEEGTTAQSGEALKMKLFALSQKRATKERLFKKSLRSRYRLIKNIMNRASEGNFDVNDINITFTENLPSMVEKELEWFTKAGGVISNKTLLSNLSFVENPEEEEERIKEEESEMGDSYPELAEMSELYGEGQL